MNLYTQRFSDYGTQVGQLLLTHDVFDYPLSKQHALDTFNALLDQGVVPIVNENDSVATDELDTTRRSGITTSCPRWSRP